MSAVKVVTKDVADQLRDALSVAAMAARAGHALTSDEDDQIQAALKRYWLLEQPEDYTTASHTLVRDLRVSDSAVIYDGLNDRTVSVFQLGTYALALGMPNGTRRIRVLAPGTALTEERPLLEDRERLERYAQLIEEQPDLVHIELAKDAGA